MTKPKSFLISTFLVALLLVVLYLVAFRVSIGSYTKSEWWIRDVYIYKDYIASSIKTPKIIIAGGSNALFGIAGQTIEEVTGYKVLNMAAHAWLDIEFLYYKIEEHMNDGDIVVLPLEFAAYQGGLHREWFFNNMISWGYDYLKKLSVYDALLFVAHSPKNRTYQGLLAKKAKTKSQNEIIEEVNAILAFEENDRWKGYGHMNLNKYGGITVDEAPSNFLLKQYKNGRDYSEDFSLSDHFLSQYRKLDELVERNNGKLILTWPVTIKNKKFNLSINEHQDKTKVISGLLAEKGIQIYCNPALFNLDIKFFFNTWYHANKKGGVIRSKTLASCIRSLIEEPDFQEMTFVESISYVELLKAEIFSAFGRRKSDLIKIKSALERFYQQNGRYPVSGRFEGLYSMAGTQVKDWINGLVPLYLNALPRDPRKSKERSEQYLYKSDGTEFKLIAHTPEDCKSVEKKYPELIDPRRNCWAYGYWTKGAENW